MKGQAKNGEKTFTRHTHISDIELVYRIHKEHLHFTKEVIKITNKFIQGALTSLVTREM